MNIDGSPSTISDPGDAQQDAQASRSIRRRGSADSAAPSLLLGATIVALNGSPRLAVRAVFAGLRESSAGRASAHYAHRHGLRSRRAA
jgi:hypothetical protein